MHSKRTLIRVLARILYACGFVLLVAGILLSAAAKTFASSAPSAASKLSVDKNPFNAVEVPFTGIQNSLPLQQPTIDPDCNCIRTPTSPVATQPAGSPSSLIFTDGCNCSCEAVTATICNVGGDMQSEVNIQLYYNPNGNPASGEIVKSGSIGPLASGMCLALNYTPTQAGNYAFHVRQEEEAAGPRDVWSSACMVDGSCYGPPPATATPFQPATNTPTTSVGTATASPTAPAVELTLTNTPTAPAATPGTPTPTPTERISTSTPTQPARQLDFNLSFICGYPGDTTMLWWVKNNTDRTSEFTWRVSGSDEQGSGTVEAHSVAYFTTSVGQKTVRLYVGGELMDSAVSSNPCKENLTLAVLCTENGQVFVARNPNTFNVDYTWTIDGQQGGRGMLPAGGSVSLVTMPVGNHRVELTWTDTRPGSHTVSINSTPEMCANPPTNTPTATITPTAPLVEFTLTPSVTNTQPVTVTPTPTLTATAPGQITPATPTSTSTSPVVIITTTPIPPTATTPAPIIITATPSFTPTRTATAPFIIVTATPTNTQPVIVITTTPLPPTPTFITPSTPTFTSTPRVIVVTPIPTDTPQIIAATPIPTDTPQIIVVTPIPSNTPQGFIAITGPSSTPTGLVTLAPPVVIITTTPALIPETGADLVGPQGLVSLGSLGGLFTNMGLFMLGTALALTGIRSLLSR